MRGAAAGLLLAPLAALAQPAPADGAASGAAPAPPVIHVVYLGGNDCPACRAWRAIELPRLQASPVFQRMRFSMVTKLVKGTVPMRFFLPDEVKPLKPVLDEANGGFGGSPQMAVVVDGVVRDYIGGAHSAAAIERIVRALEGGKPYPFAACLRLKPTGGCAQAPAQATLP